MTVAFGRAADIRSIANTNTIDGNPKERFFEIEQWFPGFFATLHREQHV
jgi:hypothetical protein